MSISASGILDIDVIGVPAPQGSKRHVGGGRMVESSRAVGPWREAVRAETQHQTGGRQAFYGQEPPAGPAGPAGPLGSIRANFPGRTPS